jgi:hypothetical protein
MSNNSPKDSSLGAQRHVSLIPEIESGFSSCIWHFLLDQDLFPDTSGVEASKFLN